MPYLYQFPSKKFLPKVTRVNGIKDKKILAFSPHSDDLSIGAGGFLSELALGNRVVPVLGYTGWRGVEGAKNKDEATKIREDEMRKEAEILGLKSPIFLRLLTYTDDKMASQTMDVKKIKGFLRKERPGIVFLPNRNDLHPRHRFLTRLVLTALKETGLKATFIFYEIPWSVFSGSEFNFIVPLSKAAVNRKISAIKAHSSQLARTDFVRLSKALLALRAGMVPEQKIGGYGSSINLGRWVEVYKYQQDRF